MDLRARRRMATSARRVAPHARQPHAKVDLNQHFKTDPLKAWSQGEIEGRAKLVADLAIKVWPAPPTASS